MSISREGRDYVLIGIAQLFLDCSIMVALSHFGLSIHLANISGRACAALAGFWMNGKITFRARDARLGKVQLLRFLLLWTGTTLASTWAVGWMGKLGGLHLAWLSKPGIELITAGIGFLVSRHWVYQAQPSGRSFFAQVKQYFAAVVRRLKVRRSQK